MSDETWVSLFGNFAWALPFALGIAAVVREAFLQRAGRPGLGWGAVGFILLFVGVGMAVNSTMALRLVPDSGKTDSRLDLEVIILVASIAFGGLGTNLLAHWLTSQKPPPPLPPAPTP